MNVSEFLRLTDEEEIERLKAIKEAVNGRPFIQGHRTKSFLEYPYWKLLAARKYYLKGDVLSLCSLTLGMGFKKLLATDYRELVYYLKYVETQFKTIDAMEARLGESDEDTSKLEMAGVSEMQKFEELNIYDELAGDDMTKWEAISRFPYKVIYVKRLKNKTKNMVMKRYMELERERK